jgi:uncharacterized membrane protein
MLRAALNKNRIGMNKEFRYRGEEPGRLENFSDAVFALAITLLLISTSPPNNFEQIKRFTFDLIPFSLCIIIIISIWHEHYIFFLRYGLRNGKVIVLNSLFLVIVLFYVYPLKFLTKLVLYPIAYLVGQESIMQELAGMIRGEDIADLMIIYGMGGAGIFFVLMLMYRYAYRNAEQLELNEIEAFDTKAKIKTNMLMGIVPLVSVTVAMILRGHWTAGMLSGFTYFLYTPIMTMHGKQVEKKRKILIEKLTDDQSQNIMASPSTE